MKQAKIIFSDVELTNKNATYSTHKILEKDNIGLIQELASIGRCEMGYAIITRSVFKEFSNIIFIPIVDSENPENKMYSALFHQAIRSALTLAKLYDIKDIIVELPSGNHEKTIYDIKPFGISLKKLVKPSLDRDRIKEIINSVSKEYPGILIKMEYLP